MGAFKRETCGSLGMHLLSVYIQNPNLRYVIMLHLIIILLQAGGSLRLPPVAPVLYNIPSWATPTACFVKINIPSCSYIHPLHALSCKHSCEGAALAAIRRLGS